MGVAERSDGGWRPEEMLARLARVRVQYWWQSVLLGQGFAAAGLAIRWVGNAFYGNVTGFIILLPAVILAALTGGRIAGFSATLACLFGGWIIAGPSAIGVGIGSPMGRVATFNFIIVSVFVTVVAASLRKTLARLDRTVDDLGLSEARFRTAVNAVRGILWTNTADGRMEGDQPGWAALTGQSHDAYRGYGWADAVHPDDTEASIAAWNRAVTARSVFDYEHRVMTAAGVYRTFAVRAVPTLDASGELIEWVGVLTDISDARAAEVALRESEERFRLMADTAPSPVWLTNATAEVEFVNEALVGFYGKPAETFLGQAWKASVHPDDIEGVNATQAEARRTFSPYGFECRFQRHDGVWRWMRVSVNPRFDGSGVFQGYVGLSFDVTETREALEALARQERRQRFLLELADGVRDLEDPQAIMDHVQSVLGRMLGASRVGYGEMSEDRLTATHMPDWVEGVPSVAGTFRLEEFGGAIEPELSRGLTVVVRDVATDPRTAASRAAFDALTVGSLVIVPLFRGGDMRAFLQIHSRVPRDWRAEEIGLIEDVADRTWSDVERARAEQEVRDSEARFRSVADTAPVLIWITNRDRSRSFVNQAYVDYMGGDYESVRTADWRSFIHPDDQDRLVEESIAGEATGQPFALEARYRHHSGEYRWLRSFSRPRLTLHGDIIGFVGVAFDVTDARRVEQDLKRINELLEDRVGEALAEKAKAEADLMHAQRMEAVGRLTGGVAHDFNNLLTVVIGALDLILKSPDDAARRQKFGEAALSAARRGERLTHQLLAFSRRQALRPETIDINALIRESDPLLRRAVGEAVTYRLKLRRGGARVSVDPAQFEAALLNLIVNARDAVGEKSGPDGGTITVQTQACDVVAGEVPELTPGPYVCITVSDTGVGMDEDTKRRVFEPFFTTKSVGKGTGLGLSQVYGFARQSGGGVRIDSTPGEGTQITIYLPPVLTDEAATPAPAVSRTDISGQSLLLVEDDVGVAAIAVDLLTAMGLDVEAVENGPDALTALARRSFDIMLTDIVMPGGMTGFELARQAAGRYSDMQIVLTSGYAGDDVDEALAEAPWPFIRKPYSSEQLRLVLGRLRVEA